jgi:hypothetical protein
MADEHDSFFSDVIHSTNSNRSSLDSKSPLIGDEEPLVYDLQNTDRANTNKESNFAAYIHVT